VIILITILSVAAVSIVIFTLKNGISPMPSSSHARSAVVNEIKKLSKSRNHLIIDAGSGWGTLALQTARNFPSPTIIGLENSFIPLWTSRLLKMRGPYNNLKFID
jgi:tRNA G46 methylase TrmB